MKKYLRKPFILLLVAIMLVPMFVIQAGAATTFERKLGVPVDYQYNYTTVRWGTDRSCKSSGCGAASASLVVEYFTGNTSQNPDTLFTWCCKNGYYYGNGLDFSTVGILCKNYGVTMSYISTQTQVINALKAGNPVIALMGPGTFTSGGHYIVLSGIKIQDGTTYIRVNDPNSSSRTNSYYTISLIFSQLKNLAVCTYSSAPKGKIDDFYVEPGKYSKVYCSDGGLNLRASNSSSSTLLVTIPNNTYLKIGSINGSWATTTYNGMSGYVYINYLRDGGEPAVSDPAITAPTSLAYGSTATVSWAKDSQATSYSYTAVAYNGETATSTGTTIASGSGTGTSFTIPAQTKGKYVKVTVTATGATNSASSSAVIMLGSYTAYPDDVQYIPVKDINGTTNESNATIWTTSKGTAFTAVYWDVFVCAPNSDGTYSVTNVSRSGDTKSVTISGNNILFAIHVSYENYSYANKIAVGDKLTFNGVYLEKNTVSAKAHILVNGGIPLAPTDITSGDNSISKLSDKAFRGFTESTSIVDAKKKFSENGEYMEIRNAKGEVVADSDILCTGYTVNIVVNGSVSVSYDIVIAGDINGDGVISASDYTSVRQVLKSSMTVSGAYDYATDVDDDGTVSTNDYILLKGHVSGTYKIKG